MSLAPQHPDKLKRLELRARQVVEGFLTGQHASPFHGSAVEFASHRPYTPGDELRHLDWKVWWKTRRLYIKRHEDQTHLPCTLVVDASRSMRYGGATGVSKFEYAATLAASLAYLLRHQQDAVGLITFRATVTSQLPPSTNPQQVDAVMRELGRTEPDEATDLGATFRQLSGLLRRRGLVVLISDLFVDRETLAAALREFHARRHEVLVFQVLHGDELTFPFDGMTLFRAMEQEAQLETEPQALRRGYLSELERFLHDVRAICARASADYVLLDMRQPLEAALAQYLHFRQRARRRGGRRQGLSP